MRKGFAIFTLESLIAGLYVAITRGLAPLFLVYGMSISEILRLLLNKGLRKKDWLRGWGLSAHALEVGKVALEGKVRFYCSPIV